MLSAAYTHTPGLPEGDRYFVTKSVNPEFGAKYVIVSGNCSSDIEKMIGITPAAFTFIGM